MYLDDYQSQALKTDGVEAVDRPLLTLLGIESRIGALLHQYQRYLLGSCDRSALDRRAKDQIGHLLWYMAVYARCVDLNLNDIARANIPNARDYAAAHDFEVAADDIPEILRFDDYQELANATDFTVREASDPMAVRVHMLGLSGESGGLLNAMKKVTQPSDHTEADVDLIKRELGDLLWYAAATCTHLGLRLADCAAENLVYARRYDRSKIGSAAITDDLPVFDASYPEQERFPRRLVVAFVEPPASGQSRKVVMSLVAAEPNSFPNGKILRPGTEDKYDGYEVGAQLGDDLTDNAHQPDGYRYHDALHFGLLAVLGWSPNLRGLLGVKRQSNKAVDEAEDGARAIFLEEGLVAMLAKRAPDKLNFAEERNVNDGTIAFIESVLHGLEVDQVPPWLWRRAVQQAFGAFRSLCENHGGYLDVNLDLRSVTYSKEPPRLS